MIVLDLEIFSNYVLVGLFEPNADDLLWLEANGPDGTLHPKDQIALRGLLKRTTSVGFNSRSFDLPIIVALLRGATCAEAKVLCDSIIGSDMPGEATTGLQVPKDWDHIDLIDVAPGKASLKLYAARLGLPSIADLPFEPSAPLHPNGAVDIREYCEGDLRNTWSLYQALKGQIELRRALGGTYGQDFRSTSDAQIAERVIISEAKKLGYKRGKRQKAKPQRFNLRDSGIIAFASPPLRALFTELLDTKITVNGHGQSSLSSTLEGRQIEIGETTYRIGIGGLHSTEHQRTLRADEVNMLVDLDVASYYPSIILQQRLAPKALGQRFLTVYQRLVSRRLKAKAVGDKVAADSLKISVNASFGKLGNQYSPLYAPHLFAQVTITGQLALLMLIERLEAEGVAVVSANTDGIVLHCARTKRDTIDQVVWDWQMDTSFELEETAYSVLAQRDVNNYIGVKVDGTVKRKGTFAVPGLMKNPVFPIVAEAVVNWLAHGVPLADTICECEDVRMFLAARRVTGGAVWRGEVLGKTVRFYLSSAVPLTEQIKYCSNGNAVPQSAGARPCQILPTSFPTDVDFGRYIALADRALTSVGARGQQGMVQRRLI